MNKYLIITILILSVIFSIVNIYTSDIPEIIDYGNEWMMFLSWIALWLISAIIFYFFQNYLPTKKRNEIIKNNFLESYKYFKLNVLEIFLSLLWDRYDEHEDFLDVKKFRDYFNDSKWEHIINEIELEDNEEYFNDLLFELGLLHKKINVLLLSVDLPNETLKFFHRLDEVLYRLQYIKKNEERYQNDNYKYFWRTLWSVFSSWSFIDWYKDFDYVEKNLEEV